MIHNQDHNTGNFMPYSLRVGSFTSPANHFNTEDAGDGAYVREDLKVSPFADVITKAALSTQLF